MNKIHLSICLLFVVILFSCAPPDGNPPTVSITDNSITVPTFTSANYGVTNAKFVHTVLYNGNLRVFYMRYTGNYHVQSADLTNLAAPETLHVDVNEIGSLDAQLDLYNNTVKIGFNTIPSLAIDDY